MRGCYSAVARFKHGYRRAEHELLRAERTTALLAHASIAPAVNLTPAWESVWVVCRRRTRHGWNAGRDECCPTATTTTS